MKTLINILYKFQQILWKIFKPQTLGARALIIENHKILLVKTTYHPSWFLPGGGVKKDENFLQAIKRELQEELGLIAENYTLHGIYNNFHEGKRDHIAVFKVENFKLEKNHSFEIEKFDFFELNNLPKDISPGTKRRIDEVIENQNPHCRNW